jgi:hypothetical protein
MILYIIIFSIVSLGVIAHDDLGGLPRLQHHKQSEMPVNTHKRK